MDVVVVYCGQGQNLYQGSECILKVNSAEKRSCSIFLSCSEIHLRKFI